jgi:DNA-binding response OmpR family regulator
VRILLVEDEREMADLMTVALGRQDISERVNDSETVRF